MPVGRFRARRPPTQMSETTAIFLAKHELSSYTAAFDEHGWDSLPALQDISDDDLKQLAVRRAERHAVYVCRGYTADYTPKIEV